MRALNRFGPGDGFFLLCAFVVVAALVLGGGTRSGFLSDVILQLLAVPLLLVSLWRYAEIHRPRPGRFALLFCAVVVLVPLLQTVPLPPEIWTKLPNRQSQIEGLELAGHGLPWMPLSLTPQATLLSALSLVVPIAIFLSTVLLDYQQRRRLSIVVLVVGLLSVFLGLSQVAQGPTSPLRFFEFTNPTEAIGFFANRNHFAALLYALLLIAAAWAVDSALSAGGTAPHTRYNAGTVIALVASFTVLVVLVAAQLMARSRAGLGLTIIALLGILALPLSDRRAASGVTPSKLLFGAVALAGVFATQFALYRIMERFASDPLHDGRITFAKRTIEAAQEFMPFGSGLGSFIPVYALFETPQDVLINRFANRAHNDFLEIWLETGVVGIALIAVFVVWFTVRAFAVWRRWPYGTRDLDSTLARAATLVVGLLVAHSIVDYPLRTGAIMAVFAFACALLVPPSIALRRAQENEVSSAQSDGPKPGDWPEEAAGHPPSSPAWASPEHQWPIQHGPANTGPPQPRHRWGQDIAWPEEWRKSPKNR